MPLPRQWIRALRSQHRLSVSSTAALLNRVQNNAASKPLQLVQAFNPAVWLDFRLIELLHALGEITTPPVPNYVDLSATWAMIRYVWAFDVPPARLRDRLRLSATARNLDFHQKTLLSDQMGVGVAALIMKNVFGMSDAVDVSLALQDLSWALFRNGARSPDYLFHDGTPNGPTFIVECKGNQTGVWQSMIQLRSGLGQVSSVAFANGRQSTSLVIATCLKEPAQVFVIDPPADADNLGSGENTSSKAQRVDKTTWKITAPEAFSHDLARLRAAKLLTFAGDFRAALGALNIDVPAAEIARLPRRGRLATRHNEYGTFYGRNFHMLLPDGGSIRLFRGLSREIRENAIDDPDSIGSAQRRGPDNDLPRGFAVVDSARRANNVVASVSDTGSLLEVAVE